MTDTSKEALDALVAELRSGMPCAELGEQCECMDERSGCHCARNANAITALRAENDALRQRAAADAVTINAKADWIEATINDMAATDQRHLEEIKSAEAAAYERAAGVAYDRTGSSKTHSVSHTAYFMEEERRRECRVIGDAIRALITPEAASALAAREAASHRAGKLEGLREAVELCTDFGFSRADECRDAILALADRIENVAE